MNTIEALKANKVPFGLMSKELQKALKEIGPEQTEQYASHWVADWDKKGFFTGNAYHLRPDYEDEPDVVKNVIFKVGGNLMTNYLHNDRITLSQAITKPNFIGLIAGDYLYGCLYRNKKDPTMVHYMILEKDLPLYEVLAPSHVLFKK